MLLLVGLLTGNDIAPLSEVFEAGTTPILWVEAGFIEGKPGFAPEVHNGCVLCK